MPRGSMVLRAGPVEMHLGAPLPTAGLADADLPALMQQVRDAMLKNFGRESGVGGQESE
jgi:hypothetical protein